MAENNMKYPKKDGIVQHPRLLSPGVFQFFMQFFEQTQSDTDYTNNFTPQFNKIARKHGFKVPNKTGRRVKDLTTKAKVKPPENENPDESKTTTKFASPKNRRRHRIGQHTNEHQRRRTCQTHSH